MKRYIIAAAILIVLLFVWAVSNSSKAGSYDELATCLVESGAKMYGTWWCPHCNQQKKDFGNSWKIIQDAGGYVECSTPEKQQTEVCRNEGIMGYPTWRFSDGTEASGRRPLSELAIRTGCGI